jgi:hypothetical protein
MDPILSRLNAVHTRTFYSCRFVSVATSHLHLRTSSCLFPIRFVINTVYAFSALPRQWHFPPSDQPDNTSRRIRLCRRNSFSLALQPNSGLGRLHETFRFTSVTRSRTVGRAPWTGDQLVARALLVHKHRKTHTQHKH